MTMKALIDCLETFINQRSGDEVRGHFVAEGLASINGHQVKACMGGDMSPPDRYSIKCSQV
jgi:hypothetical protein